MSYAEEEWLQLSGIQHFEFCRRRWALIHLENQWAENFYTTDGSLMHRVAHDESRRESRGDLIIVRGMRVHSADLGVSGNCDVVEFRRVSGSKEGIPLPDREGLWRPMPVEYKRGKPGSRTEADAMQLCAQAICLEEMLCCSIPLGNLYYGETRHREIIELDEELRNRVKATFEEMHALQKRGYTPRSKPSKACNACSLKELCLPKLSRSQSASQYIRKHLEEGR